MLYLYMKRNVEVHEEFAKEIITFSEEVQDSIFSRKFLLEEFGTQLARPVVDTLKGSEFANMKELRFSVGKEVWRVAFAFDPERKAILLVGGDKRGKSQKRFYKKLIKIADERFLDHLNNLQKDK